MRGLDISSLRRKLMETLGASKTGFPDAFEMARAAFECREYPVDLLFRIATLASRVADFPDTVTFREHEGYRQGLAAVRQAGVWRLDGGATVAYEGDVVSAGRSDNFMLAMNGAYRTAHGRNLPETAFAPWNPEDLRGQLETVSAALPAHVVLASLGRGRSIAVTLGLPVDPELFGKWVDAVTSLGHHIDTTPAYGAAPALFALMHSSRPDDLATLIARGARLDASFDGDTALTGAISGGKLECARVLLAHGALLAPDRDGISPLRRALDSFDTLFLEGSAVAMTRFLLDAGQDPYLQDPDGRSAADEAAALVDKDDHSETPEVLEVIAMYEATLDAAPAMA